LLLLDRRELFARRTLLPVLVREAPVGLALPLAVLALHLGTVFLERDADLGLVCGRRRFLLASRSEAELGQRLTQIPAGGFPVPPASLLPAGAALTIQKQRLSDATEGALATIKRSLRNERNTLLRNSLTGSLGVLIGSAILSAFVDTTTRWIWWTT
jgi:hypothetical protein